MESVNLGFQHTTDIHAGVTKMWEWAKKQPIRPRQIWSKYEVEQGLYPFWKTDVLIGEAQAAHLKN